MYKTVRDNDKRYRALRYSNASWRKMLVSQPPAAELVFWSSSHQVGLSRTLSYTFNASRMQDFVNTGQPQVFSRSSGLKIADLMPQYGFNLDEEDLRYFTVRLDTEDSRAWKRPRMAELTAQQLQLWLAGCEGEDEKDYEPEAYQYESVKAAFASL